MIRIRQRDKKKRNFYPAYVVVVEITDAISVLRLPILSEFSIRSRRDHGERDSLAFVTEALFPQ